MTPWIQLSFATMSFFKNISQEQFIREIWQKKPYVFEQAFPDIAEITDGNDLAGLACEAEVESRVISGEGLKGEWQCKQGPFAEKDFANLPQENWTLLVQGLDQWNEQAWEILQQFSFLPKWRLEDIMASYAPIGGSVGPHFDYYDVFLIQASGVREWQLGQQCHHNTALQDNDQVKLLTEFDCQEKHQIYAGDMIYIPAGMAHWGIATTDNCITLSVGFRAPSRNEILIQSLELMIEQLSGQKNSQRYRDSADAIDTNPYKINTKALGLLSTDQIPSGPELSEVAFGQLVTEQRHLSEVIEPEDWSAEELSQFLKENPRCNLIQDISARFAFTENYLFVNGEAYKVAEDFSEMLCRGQIERGLGENELGVLLELVSEGSVQIDGKI